MNLENPHVYCANKLDYSLEVTQPLAVEAKSIWMRGRSYFPQKAFVYCAKKYLSHWAEIALHLHGVRSLQGNTEAKMFTPLNKGL